MLNISRIALLLNFCADWYSYATLLCFREPLAGDHAYRIQMHKYDCTRN